MAMKLLEKDIHEKQDTIVSLRRQLEDIKSINLDMYRKLQVISGLWVWELWGYTGLYHKSLSKHLDHSGLEIVISSLVKFALGASGGLVKGVGFKCVCISSYLRLLNRHRSRNASWN